jgi:hypothetical protein
LVSCAPLREAPDGVELELDVVAGVLLVVAWVLAVLAGVLELEVELEPQPAMSAPLTSTPTSHEDRLGFMGSPLVVGTPP